MAWRIRKYPVKEGKVFTMNLPTGATILSTVVSGHNSIGGTSPRWIYFLALVDEDAPKIERTFIVYENHNEVAPSDVDQIRNGHLTFIGLVEFPVEDKEPHYYHIFEDVSLAKEAPLE